MSGDNTAESRRTAGPSDGRREVARALREIRREGYKVAVVYGVVDAALATLLTTLLVRLVGPAWLQGSVLLAQVAPPSLGLPNVALPLAILVGVAVGLLVFVAEILLRVRRPLVEQFETANPAIEEMLRTARDAVAADRDSRMAGRLYRDVLAALRETSSLGLVDLRRLTVTLAVVVVLSVASIQVAVVDLQFGGDELGPTGPADEPTFDGLRDGDEVLGEPEDVAAGDEDLDAEVGGSGDGDAPPGGAPSAYDSSGLPSGDIDSQQAGFSSGERLEDAELIRDYTLELRNETNV